MDRKSGCSSVPSINGGQTLAQTFLVVTVHSKSEFPEVLMDFLMERGAPHTLTSDCANEEASAEVKRICRKFQFTQTMFFSSPASFVVKRHCQKFWWSICCFCQQSKRHCPFFNLSTHAKEKLLKKHALLDSCNKASQETCIVGFLQQHTSVVVEVVTCWWRCYLIIECLILIKTAIDAIVIHNQLGGHESLELTDWQNLEMIKKVLMSFVDATKWWEDDSCVTASWAHKQSKRVKQLIKLKNMMTRHILNANCFSKNRFHCDKLQQFNPEILPCVLLSVLIVCWITQKVTNISLDGNHSIQICLVAEFPHKHHRGVSFWEHQWSQHSQESLCITSGPSSKKDISLSDMVLPGLQQREQPCQVLRKPHVANSTATSCCPKNH